MEKFLGTMLPVPMNVTIVNDEVRFGYKAGSMMTQETSCKFIDFLQNLVKAKIPTPKKMGQLISRVSASEPKSPVGPK